MACVGSAIGFGNIWGFPYKMGTHGGAAFLLVYIVLCVFAGFAVMFDEIFLGRRDSKGPFGTYRLVGERSGHKFGFVAWMSFVSAIALWGFYCTLGGYVLKYCVAYIGDMFGAGFGTSGNAEDYFFNFIASGMPTVVFTLLFILLTTGIALGGVSGGVERFCKVGMPLLFLIMLVLIIRNSMLPGSGAGWEFILKPDWNSLTGGQLINTMSSAGGQMFFSLSLGVGGMITYGSYLNKDNNLKTSAIAVVAFDTLAALMAAFMVFPAVFAFGLEPTSGPSLLFITMGTVFDKMSGGAFFGFLFYFLVLVAGLSTSLAFAEIVIKDFEELTDKNGKPMSRNKALWLGTLITAVINIIVSLDGLGTTGLVQPLGFCWLDFLDLIGEGILMPLGSFFCAIICGWIIGRDKIVEEATIGGEKFTGVGFYMVCTKIIAPIFMIFVLFGQIDSFFQLGWFS